ncbi:hypothetical protein T440DRAFT_470266 [Plenodomus tracheiphilus IPT5]|uniref:Interferon-related developmental regulator N-terminal domain-containing protein n=1 Tax=Plenodomus tracheiphilus IPT5 TaxID=1408161 RepID=A0A6A7AYN4_9PLEO|nr:hypothetical protein T440DRAFT_470266 [Plenodomus tracheiphilus IPT5]
MRDLRRQALESHKTVSRKARSRVVSTAASKSNSTVASPSQSRAASRTRQVSDDDEDYLSDGTAWSTNSIDDILNGEDVDIPEDAWKSELNTRIEQITNLKRSSTEGRAESLNAYAHILMARYAKDEVELHIGELLPSMLRSIKQETTEREAVKALKALAVTVLTLDSADIYDDIADQLKRSIQSSGSVEIKANAIYTLGLAASFAGAGDDEILDIMNFFLEIIESDGASVEAQDDGDVVIAALEQWGLLATQIEDLEEETEAAAEAFVEQLESADSGVQVAAGENIALLYEKSYTAVEADDEEPSDNDDPDDPEFVKDGTRMIRRYQVYRRQDQLLRTLEELASVSTRRISKKDRKTLHSSFVDIRNSVERPTRGPGYSTALDKETGKARGAGTIEVRINRDVVVRVDKWWKLLRLNALRRALQGGFTYHYDQNETVSSVLPFTMSRRVKTTK